MTELSFQLGKVSLGKKFFDYNPRKLLRPLFITEAKGPELTTIVLHIGKAEMHENIAHKAKATHIVGGGGFGYDGSIVTMGGCSGDYHAIPLKVMETYAALLQPEFVRVGFNVQRIVAEAANKLAADKFDEEVELNPFWVSRGYAIR